MAIELAQKRPRKNRQASRPDTREISTVSIYNRYSTYPSHGLTPERLTSIFKEADQGDIYRQSELQQEMLEKDNALFGMYNARKLGVLKYESEILAISDDAAAIKHADYVREVIDNIKNWRGTLGDILDAVAKAISVNQIMWQIEGGDVWIDRIEHADLKNFRFGKGSDYLSDLNVIRRLTDGNRIDGVELEINKWIVAIMKARSGHPSRGSLLRTNAWMYLFKNFDVKAWIQFAEIYGLPIRIGKYPAMEKDNETFLSDLESALRNLGQDASAIIPDTAAIEFVEAAQKAATSSLHGELADFCNKENSLAILGHSGAAMSTPGQLGNASEAMEAKIDLIQADGLALDYIISDQLIRPLIDFKFGTQDKYPYFKTLIKPPVDKVALVNVYDGAINRIGLPVASQDVYDALGIRQPEEGEEILMPRPQQINPFAASAFSHVIAGDGKKKLQP
jgi:phage gp29-like protein